MAQLDAQFVTPKNGIWPATEIVLGGARVHLVERKPLFDLISRAVVDDQPLALGSANLDHIFHFGVHGAYRDRLGNGELRWLTLLDGAPLALRAAQLTRTQWQRQAGSDLLEPIVDTAQAHGWAIGFVGGTSAMHELLRSRLARSHPPLTIAGFWAPERAELDDPVLAAELATSVGRARPDILAVGLGKPRQELWIERHWKATGATVLLAFGAAADFLAGTVDRAPRVFRATGTEFAYRFAREPRRLAGRYLSDAPKSLRCLMRDSYVVASSPAITAALESVDGERAAEESSAPIPSPAGSDRRHRVHVRSGTRRPRET